MTGQRQGVQRPAAESGEAAAGPTPDSDALWHAVRRFPTGVSVVTAGSGAAARGTTVSAFTFISRQPPLVSVCLARGSALLDVIQHNGCFTVNVLNAEQAAVARIFADRRRRPGAEQFDGVPWIPAPQTGVPLLLGAVCWIDCQYQRRIVLGDHELVVAQATAATDGDGLPLLYFAGTLRPWGTHQEELRK